jgi:hypothetical protein
MLGSVVGGVVPIVGGLLLFALPHWRCKQRFTALHLELTAIDFPQLRPFKPRPQVGVGRLKPAPPSSRGGPTGAAG